MTPTAPVPVPVPLAVTEDEIDELQALLDRVPSTHDALDVSMVDGFLCATLLQPQRVTPERLLTYVTDIDGKRLPPRFDATRLHALVLKRHAVLDDAIARRQWFDPWVFELDDAEGATADAHQGAGMGDGDGEGHVDSPTSIDAVYPWAAGFATALDIFPGLMALDEQVLTEPLALIYRHLDADDLEDADVLLAEIETHEPPQDLAEAVEEIVRATLLLADIARPLRADPPPRRPAPSRPSARRRH